MWGSDHIAGVDAELEMTVGRSGAERANWVTSWVASMQGPYPVGNPSAQPDLALVFPSAVIGARDQSFRLIIKPERWGRQMRLRFSNAFGTQPVTFDGIFAGLQWSGSAVIPKTNCTVTFREKRSVTLAPGESVWSDPVILSFVNKGSELRGRKLAVSFHVAGISGPMSWHAKALQSSYVTLPGAGPWGHDETESEFPFPTTSWYFLDAVDMDAPKGTVAIVAFGYSITDGTASTLNGDDRWPDVLARRLANRSENRLVVLNAGIGGNQIIGPKEYSPIMPCSGGPSALQRLERDVLSLSGVRAVVWLEGINDFGANGNAEVDAVISGICEGVGRIRGALPGVRVLGATLPSALGSTCEGNGFVLQDEKRKKLNGFIRSSDVFDGVADFDCVTLDPQTGEMKAEFIPNTTVGGPGDKLHPNRLGYQAMALAIDLDLFNFKAPLPVGEFGMMTSRADWWKGLRGEWYVFLQAVLVALILLGPETVNGFPPWPKAVTTIAKSAGVVLMVLGMAMSILAATHLGSNLTPLPHPKDNASLVVTGLYRLVRHPIYFGVIMMAMGWAVFVQGWLTLAYAAVLVLFFDIKSRQEEVWLLQRFPDYMEYRKHVKKLIPFIY